VAHAITDTGDNAIVVGGHGVVVPPRSPERLADAIIAALDRDTPSAREARSNWIVRNFRIERMVDASLRTLMTTANAHPNG
jgi:hypothetical protein